MLNHFGKCVSSLRFIADAIRFAKDKLPCTASTRRIADHTDAIGRYHDETLRASPEDRTTLTLQACTASSRTA